MSLIDHFNFEEPGGDVRIDISGTDKHLYFEIENDGYGDSNVRFCATLHLDMDPVAAENLRDFLNDWLVAYKKEEEK